MTTETIKPGRPKGKRTYEEMPAKAFGAAVLSMRVERRISQELLANMAEIGRSHIGKIERGEHMPNLALILRIANALGCSAAELIAETESRLTLIDTGKTDQTEA
ncbi:transcriptional regulator (plasmid) [Rhizobium sp. ACO-34A]|nr:helix-turn-helix transcriptional regulator [Rhizobium sp. ACO-34A]ATN36782.1 transcriptional regulator [Rhizobium sp. ACO-34A]